MQIKIAVTALLMALNSIVPAKAASAVSPCTFAEDPRQCEVKSKQFQADFPKANHGDYLAQREVAFCFWTGCNGALSVDLVQACSWETVIVSTEMSDMTDNFNFRQICELLSKEERGAANIAASNLYQKIYMKPMTKPLPYEGRK